MHLVTSLTEETQARIAGTTSTKVSLNVVDSIGHGVAPSAIAGGLTNVLSPGDVIKNVVITSGEENLPLEVNNVKKSRIINNRESSEKGK